MFTKGCIAFLVCERDCVYALLKQYLHIKFALGGYAESKFLYRLRIVSEDKVRMQRRLFLMNDKKRNPNPTVDEFGFLGFGGAT